jgi:hypothetical protein
MFRKRKDKFPMHLEQTYLRYMMFVIESAIANMKNGKEQWIWVLDLSGEEGRGQARALTVGVCFLGCVHLGGYTGEQGQ